MKRILMSLFTVGSLAANLPAFALTPVGTNDFRISQSGSDGDDRAGLGPKAVYNPVAQEYLVIWASDGGYVGQANDEFEIFGQRIDAITGAEVGETGFRISDMGTDGDPVRGIQGIALSYDSVDNEYLVLWTGDAGYVGQVDEEYEVFGQRLDAAGAEVGVNDFRISDMGTDGNANFDALNLAVEYNPVDNEYLVAWSGTDEPSLEQDIYIQRLNAATGAEVGGNDVRITHMGPDGTNAFGTSALSVVHDPVDDQYLIVYLGEDDAGALVDGETEIFGQRLDGAGAEIGDDDFRISDMGTDGDTDTGVFFMDAAFDPVEGRYLVLWQGDDAVNGENEIYGQFLDAATGAEVGDNDFRLTNMGPDGDPEFDALNPVLAYNAVNREYLAVWVAEGGFEGQANGEFEIFAARLDAKTGAFVDGELTRISDMGADGDAASTAIATPPKALAFDPDRNQYLAVWFGDDITGGLLDDEYEVYGQLLADPVCGNGFLEGSAGEECDDGNTADGDGCSGICVVEDAPGSSGTAGGTSGDSDADSTSSGGCSLVK